MHRPRALQRFNATALTRYWARGVSKRVPDTSPRFRSIKHEACDLHFYEWPQRDLNPCYRLESSDQRVFRRFSSLRKVVRFSSPEVLFGPFSVLDVIRPFSLSRVQNVSRQELVRRFDFWAGKQQEGQSRDLRLRAPRSSLGDFEFSRLRPFRWGEGPSKEWE